MRMKQREILNAIALDFARDNETQEQYIDRKIDNIKQAVKEYILSTNMNGFILGLSGGIDSFVAAALLADALKDIGKEMHLLMLPNGVQADIGDSEECGAVLQGRFENVVVETVSIENSFKGMVKDISASVIYNPEDRSALGNIQARLRMVAQYALARGLLVAGTDHATENVTGYYTKYGDGGSDFNPIDGLVKTDIYAIAERYGAPECVKKKKPAAGLGISENDEAELGITYAELCSYLTCHQIEKTRSERIAKLYEAAEHKRHMPASPVNRWWCDRRQDTTHIVVDMLYDFIDGVLACNNADAAVKSVIEHIDQNPSERVFYVRDHHPAEHCSFKENGGMWPAHCVAGTRGGEFDARFYDIKKTINTPIERYNVFSKGKDASREQYSGFDSANEFYGALKFNLTHTVIVSGIATEYCVRETVSELLSGGFDVKILKDGLAYIDENAHSEVLAEMEALGAKLI